MIQQTPASGDDAAQYLPARMLNEFSYCPRLLYLEYVDGLFAHNRFTVEGAARHKRLPITSRNRPTAKLVLSGSW
jgi:hypothetical protein